MGRLFKNLLYRPLLNNAPCIDHYHIICNLRHNPQCVDALAAALESLYPGRKLIFLSGVLADKDWHSMFRRVLPLAKAFVAVTPDSPRALPAAELAAWLAQFSIPVSVQETLDQGVDTALALAGPEDVICAWGSLYSVGEIRHHLGLC